MENIFEIRGPGLRQHGVHYKSGTLRGRYVVGLNYDQTSASPSNPIASSLRGAVLSLSEPYNPEKTLSEQGARLVCRPLHRFFNDGEGAWLGSQMMKGFAFDDEMMSKVKPGSNALPFLLGKGGVIFEKYDGTCFFLYYLPEVGEWCVGTRNVPFADVSSETISGPMTGRQIFEAGIPNTIRDRTVNGLAKAMGAVPGITYVFEGFGPLNPLKVHYESQRIVLLAARSIETGAELSLSELKILGERAGIEVAKTYDFTKAGDLAEWIHSQKGSDLEGVVVMVHRPHHPMGNFRVKVKNINYLLASGCSQMMNKEAITTAVLSGVWDDIRTEVPETTRQSGDEIAEKVANYLRREDGIADRVREFREKAPRTRKEVAAMILELGGNTSVQFGIVDGRYQSASDWVAANKDRHGYKAPMVETILR